MITNESRERDPRHREMLVFILTSSYPFLPGEQFLESEIPIWKLDFPGQIVLIPKSAEGTPREIPAGVSVSSTLSNLYNSRLHKAYAICSGFFSTVLWKEFGYLAWAGKLSRATIVGSIVAIAHSNLAKSALRQAACMYGRPDLVYSYWFGPHTHGATRALAGVALITRAHGSDLYETESPEGHKYFRRQYINCIDKIYAVSQNGLAYLKAEFNAEESAQLSRLGIKVSDHRSNPSDKHEFSILSLSSCTRVKNVDKIIHAIRLVADKMPTVRVTWTHIGEGNLKAALEEQARMVFSTVSMEWKFTGQMSNDQVLSYIEENNFDMILNASSSEGVPVSLMEAMARGIPAVAPDVGGISDLVSNQNGILLSGAPSAGDIAEAIVEGIEHLKSPSTRNSAVRTIENRFDCDVNYRQFIAEAVACTREPRG